MTKANTISIDITTTDKAGLSRLVANARKAGKDVEKALGDGFEKTERSSTKAADKMSTAFKGTVSSMTRELDKLERNAALSGDGMSEGYSDALAKVRADLTTVAAEASRTGRNFDEGLSGALRSVQRATDELKPTVDQLDKSFDQAARGIERDLMKIERAAWQTGDKLDKAFSGSLNELRADLDRVRRDAARTGDGLESELGGALQSVRAQADEMADSLRTSAASSGDGGGLVANLLGDVGALKSGALAAGAAAGAFLWQGLQAEWQEDKIGGLISAQSGGTATQGRRIGDIVGDAFSDGFGDSMEGVGEAVNAALSKGLVTLDAPQEVIDEITKMAATAAQVTGKSADEVASAVRVMLATDLAGSTREAFDLVVAGFQRGADAGGDFLEELTQSSSNLKQFGFTGEQSVGVFIQALEAGAPSADAFTGSLEELVGNASDGIPIFQQLGLGGTEFANALVGGGPKAAKALDQLLDRIRAIESPAERSRVMVQLFGEEATAMQDAILAVDPSSAADKMKDFAGATEDAAKVIQETTSFWDKLGRGISGVANDVGEFLDHDFSDMMEDMPDVKGFLDEVNAAQKDFDTTGSVAALDDLKEKYPELGEKIDAYVKKKRDEQSATEDTTAATQEYVSSLEELINAAAEASGKVLSMSEAQIGFNEDLAAAHEAVKKFAGEGLNAARTEFDLSTEAGREMRGSLNDVAAGAMDVMEAMVAQNGVTKEVQGFVQGARDQFIQMAKDMGLSAGAAEQLANDLGLIPGNYVATVAVSGYEAAYAKVEALESKLRQLPTNKQINIRVSTSGSGHYLVGQASGGIAPQQPWGAASGGARHSSTIMNEVGPEVAEHPDGTRVLTAGATRALAESGAFSMGSGATQVVLSMDSSDPLIRAIMESMRAVIRNEHGGSVTAALGQRGAA